MTKKVTSLHLIFLIYIDSILPDDDAIQQIRFLCAQLQSLQDRASLRDIAKSSIAQLANQCSVFCPQHPTDIRCSSKTPKNDKTDNIGNQNGHTDASAITQHSENKIINQISKSNENVIESQQFGSNDIFSENTLTDNYHCVPQKSQGSEPTITEIEENLNRLTI